MDRHLFNKRILGHACASETPTLRGEVTYARGVLRDCSARDAPESSSAHTATLGETRARRNSYNARITVAR
jgi:hypothetical protein